MNSHGFTLIELIVSVSVFGILSLIAIPSFSETASQLRASYDVRNIATTVARLRSESIRQHTNIEINFISSGFSWDIDNDGTVDGSLALSPHSSWQGGAPATVMFNGLGLLRGLSAANITIGIKNGSSTIQLRLNRNGFIEL